MAGDWLKMEASTPEKPEVLSITARMGWDDPDLTVGKLFRVWRWFDQQTTDGNAKNVTHALLDRIAGVSGFAKAMELEGWLLVLDDGVSLPNFTKHNGATAKNRSETARRVAKHRAKHDGDAGQYVRLTLPRPIREAVLARDGRQCVYCSRKEGEYTATETKTAGVLNVDHVIPVCRGGSDELCNLATACSTCNMFKGDRTPDECGFVWPVGADGKRLGNEKNVTAPLAREEKRREESNTTQPLPFPSVRELLQGIVDRSTATSAAEFHAFVAGELRGIGWAVEEEVEVPDRGDGRCGRVDLLVTAPVRVAIELDRGSVRTKSVNKLQQIDALRIVVLRDKREHEDVHGLDAVICRRTAVEPSRGRVALKAWAAATKAKGETLIPEDDGVFGYADKAGIPREFLDLAWPAFRHRYTVQYPEKRYVDWRRVFRNAVEGNWLKLWYADQNGEYRLTTTGIQAQRAMAESA